MLETENNSQIEAKANRGLGLWAILLLCKLANMIFKSLVDMHDIGGPQLPQNNHLFYGSPKTIIIAHPVESRF